MLWLMVLLRVVSNPFSNVFQKMLTRRQADPLFIIFATHGLLSLVCLPLGLSFVPQLSGDFWVNIVICAALAVAANVLIVQAVKVSDLSLLGPINAYKPIVSLIPAMVLLREIPAPAGLGGIGLIVAGSYCLGPMNPRATAARRLRGCSPTAACNTAWLRWSSRPSRRSSSSGRCWSPRR